MVPAAVMGLDIAQLLERAEEMVEGLFPSVPVEENPGVMLGYDSRVFAKHGRDKGDGCILARCGLLRRLAPNNSGRIDRQEGKGIIPVDCETVGYPTVYGTTELFVYIRLETARRKSRHCRQPASGQGIRSSRIAVNDLYDLGQNFSVGNLPRQWQNDPGSQSVRPA